MESRFWSDWEHNTKLPENEWLARYSDPTLPRDMNRHIDAMLLAWKTRGDVVRDKIAETAAKTECKETACVKCKFPACCWQTIFIGLVDALPMAREIRRRGKDTPEYREMLRAHGDKMLHTHRKDYWTAHIFCPFVRDPTTGGDGLCDMYDVRALICRKYYVGGDPKVCIEAASGDPDKTIAVNFVPSKESTLIEWRWNMEMEHHLGLWKNRDYPLIYTFSTGVYVALCALGARSKQEFRDIIRKHPSIGRGDLKEIGYFGDNVNPVPPSETPQTPVVA